jgi:hypothetical protein
MMDKVFLSKDANAYDPAAEARVAMTRGISEVAAVAIAFLRGMVICTKKLKVASCAVQSIPSLYGKLEVKTDTALILLKSSEFWYSAPSWINRYATERANSAFSKVNSQGQIILPWLMKLYSGDAHLGVVISNFIEANLFAPFEKDSLISVYAREFSPKELSTLPTLLKTNVPEPYKEMVYNLCLGYNALNVLVRKSKLAALVTESPVVMRQLLFAYEVAISEAFDKRPPFVNSSEILNAAAIADFMEPMQGTNTLLKLSNADACVAMSKLLTKKFGVKDTVENEKALTRSLKSAGKGETFGAFHVILGQFSSALNISIV